MEDLLPCDLRGSLSVATREPIGFDGVLVSLRTPLCLPAGVRYRETQVGSVRCLQKGKRGLAGPWMAIACHARLGGRVVSAPR
jgi:hypothetical protein